MLFCLKCRKYLLDFQRLTVLHGLTLQKGYEGAITYSYWDAWHDAFAPTLVRRYYDVMLCVRTLSYAPTRVSLLLALETRYMGSST